MYRGAIKNTWTVEEVDFGTDVADLARMSPAERHLVQRLVSGPVELVTVGLSEGFSTDYGHGDLVLGRRAPDEVFPRIAEFLARHATAP